MHLSPEELDNQRADVAQHVFESYDFGSDLDVNDSEQWDNSLSHDRTRTVYADVIGSDDKTRLFLHVRFKDGSSEIEEAYALDANSGNEVGRNTLDQRTDEQKASFAAFEQRLNDQYPNFDFFQPLDHPLNKKPEGD